MLELAQYVTRIQIDSEWLPPIVLDNPFQPGPPNPFLEGLKPRITMEIAGGAVEPVVIAPYGEPRANRWPLVKGALVVGGLLLLMFLGGRLAR